MPKFDEEWIKTRFKNRRAMVGSAYTVDAETGFLAPKRRTGFTVEKKGAFLRRFELCNNQAQIAKSVDIDIQAVYDAVALDDKFRAEFMRCLAIPGRPKHLADGGVDFTQEEKSELIGDLLKRANRY